MPHGAGKAGHDGEGRSGAKPQQVAGTQPRGLAGDQLAHLAGRAVLDSRAVRAAQVLDKPLAVRIAPQARVARRHVGPNGRNVAVAHAQRPQLDTPLARLDPVRVARNEVALDGHEAQRRRRGGALVRATQARHGHVQRRRRATGAGRVGVVERVRNTRVHVGRAARRDEQHHNRLGTLV